MNRPTWCSSTLMPPGPSTARAGQPIGEHAVSGHDPAGHDHRDAASGRVTARTARSKPGERSASSAGGSRMNTATAIATLHLRLRHRGPDRRGDPADAARLETPLGTAGRGDRGASGGAGRSRLGNRGPPPGACTWAAPSRRIGSIGLRSGDLGYRTKAVLTRYPKGILLERSGTGPIWIPQESISAIRTEKGWPAKCCRAPDRHHRRRNHGDPLAASVGHRDRHRLPRRRPSGLLPMAGRRRVRRRQ